MKKVGEKYLNERFDAFLKKEGISKEDMSEEVFLVMRTGHRFLLSMEAVE